MMQITLFSLTLMSIDSFLYYRVMNSNMTYKYNSKYKIVVFLLMFGLLFIRYIIGENYPSNIISYLTHASIIMSLFIISFFLYKGSNFKKLAVPLFFIVLLTLSELVVMLIFAFITKKTPTQVGSDEAHYYQIALISKVIVLIVLELYNRRNIILEFPRHFFYELLIISGVDLAFLIYVATKWRGSSTPINAEVNGMISIMLYVVFIISAITITLLFRLTKHAEREIANNLRFQQIEMENKLNRDMTSIVDNLRSLRHDMNAHMGVLKGLLEFKQYEDMSKYLDSICQELVVANNFLVIENKVLSVLINSKMTKAVDLGIDFIPIITIKNILMTDRDMCALIANIIENSIEAAEQVADNKYIMFKMEEKNGHCIIHCENTYSVKPVIKYKNFITTKPEKNLHGIGTKTIKSIVEKYNGFLNITIGDLFIINIDIPSEE